eukprot:767866-Hanusia_phi.AAC.5
MPLGRLVPQALPGRVDPAQEAALETSSPGHVAVQTEGRGRKLVACVDTVPWDQLAAPLVGLKVEILGAPDLLDEGSGGLFPLRVDVVRQPVPPLLQAVVGEDRGPAQPRAEELRRAGDVAHVGSETLLQRLQLLPRDPLGARRQSWQVRAVVQPVLERARLAVVKLVGELEAGAGGEESSRLRRLQPVAHYLSPPLSVHLVNGLRLEGDPLPREKARHVHAAMKLSVEGVPVHGLEPLVGAPGHQDVERLLLLLQVCQLKSEKRGSPPITQSTRCELQCSLKFALRISVTSVVQLFRSPHIQILLMFLVSDPFFTRFPLQYLPLCCLNLLLSHLWYAMPVATTSLGRSCRVSVENGGSALMRRCSAGYSNEEGELAGELLVCETVATVRW